MSFVNDSVILHACVLSSKWAVTWWNSPCGSHADTWFHSVTKNRLVCLIRSWYWNKINKLLYFFTFISSLSFMWQDISTFLKTNKCQLQVLQTVWHKSFTSLRHIHFFIVFIVGPVVVQQQRHLVFKTRMCNVHYCYSFFELSHILVYFK